MRFEWDPTKRIQNLQRHGIDFEDALALFTGPMLVGVDDRFDYGEVRFFGLGFLRDAVVAVSFTEINGDIIRIISMRRAVKQERLDFYEHLRN